MCGEKGGAKWSFISMSQEADHSNDSIVDYSLQFRLNTRAGS